MNTVRAELPGESDDTWLFPGRWWTCHIWQAQTPRFRRWKLQTLTRFEWLLPVVQWVLPPWLTPISIAEEQIRSNLLYWDSVLKGVKGMHGGTTHLQHGTVARDPHDWCNMCSYLTNTSVFIKSCDNKKNVAPIYGTQNPVAWTSWTSKLGEFLWVCLAHLLIWVDGCTFRLEGRICRQIKIALCQKLNNCLGIPNSRGPNIPLSNTYFTFDCVSPESHESQ